jgi:hypothetical protein
LFKWTLYEAGFRHIKGNFAARDEEHAIKQAQDAFGLHALPCEAKEVKLDGFIINIVKEGEDVQSKDEQPVGKRGGVSKSDRGPDRTK